MSKRKSVRYDPANDHYAVLGVLPSASLDDIRRSFRLRAKEVHPDRNPDNVEWAHRQFQRLNEAYDVLTDPELRAVYDARRRAFTRERGPDGTAWWERPHPASAPPASSGNAANSGSNGPFRASPPPSQRRVYPLRRKRDEMRPYQVLFIVSSMILVGSICASMTRVRVDVPETPGVVAQAPPTLAVSPDIGAMCLSPNATISDPPYGGEVSGRFSIRGTASGPHFLSYRVDIRPYNVPNSVTDPVPGWIPLLPGEQTQPVENGVLVPDSMTADLPPGNYLIRLMVRLDDGYLAPCWWPILKRQ